MTEQIKPVDFESLREMPTVTVEQIVRFREAALSTVQQRNGRLLSTLKDARDWIDKNNFGGCDTFALLEKIDAIIAEAGGKV